MKFSTRVRLKPSNDGGEFELDRARSKDSIAKKLFALGHETDNTVKHLKTDPSTRYVCQTSMSPDKNILNNHIFS